MCAGRAGVRHEANQVPGYLHPQTCLQALSELPATLSVQKGLGSTCSSPRAPIQRGGGQAHSVESPQLLGQHTWEWGPGSRTAGDARAHPSLRTFSALQDPTDVVGLGLGSQTRDTATQRPSTAHKQRGHGCSGTISRNLGPQHVNSLPPTPPN